MPDTIATIALVISVGAVTLNGVIFIRPTIISFQISATIKPNAAAIATAIVLLISFMVTIFSPHHIYNDQENILELYNNFEKKYHVSGLF
jgi:hypothetical protein